MHHDTIWYVGNIVLNGDPAPPKRGIAPQFSAHVYCGQMLAHITTAELLFKLPLLDNFRMLV